CWSGRRSRPTSSSPCWKASRTTKSSMTTRSRRRPRSRLRSRKRPSARRPGPLPGRVRVSPAATPPSSIAPSAVKLMGVVNVTPDSFSDGGLYLDPQAAIAHGKELAADGAAILDVGGESSRPGAAPVAADEELRRVEPVVAGLVGLGPEISVDTSKATVAEAALDAGATIVNDVTALRGDPEMAGLVADRGAGAILMHMAGDPRTMQVNPEYGDVVAEVREFLAERLATAVAAGIAEERIWLDPGIGF